MIRLTISPAAYAVIAATLPASALEQSRAPNGEFYVWLEPQYVHQLRATGKLGESFSEVIVRLAAAAQALAELEGEEQTAVSAFVGAQGEVVAASHSVMLSEADAIALRIEALEGEALELRVRLAGGSMSPIATMNLKLSEPLTRVLRGTDALDRDNMFARNGALWNGIKSASAQWQGYVPALVANPDAELNFAPAAEEAQRAA